MRLNIFNKKRYIKESKYLKERLEVTSSREAFINDLNDFMRNPPFNENYEVQKKGKNKDGIEIDYSQCIDFIKKVWDEALTIVGIAADSKNEGVSVRINSIAKTVVTFKIFIYDKNSSKDQLKHSRSSSFGKISLEIEKNGGEKIQVNFLDTGYGKSDIPNFYFEGPNTENKTLYAKTNSKLQKATEAAESLVACYFNYLNDNNITTFDNEPLSAEVLGVENIPCSVDINDIKEAIKVICNDREWNLSCKANALGILKFLGDQIRKKFTAKHPSWDGQKEKDIVINEYLDPSDIFLVIEGDDNFVKNYKEKCKSPFIKDNPRTLGVSLKKLKAATNEIVGQDKPSKKVFKTPNFFLTGWREEESPKVIYMENPAGFDPKNNYIISNVSITVSSSDKEGVPGKTMYFKCKINGKNDKKKEELLFTIRKNGGENFVLESAGSEDTESQGGKCTPLISFVLGKVFENLFNKVGENFKAAKEEFERIKKGEKANKEIIKKEIRDIEAILKEIQNLKTKDYNAEENREIVKRAAIAFAFAKKLPFFSEDKSADKLVIEAFDKLGYNGDTYEKDSEMPIYLGLGKNAYYQGN